MTKLHSPVMDKSFVTAEQLQLDSWELGLRVLESTYRPTHLIGVWRGGAPIAISVHEFLVWSGHKCDHIPIRCEAYSNIDLTHPQVTIYGLEYFRDAVSSGDRILIVDDVHDTGRSLATLITKLCALHNDCEIKTACVYFKPSRNQVAFEPDYYIHQSSNWLVFPHELVGLTEPELARKNPAFSKFEARLAALRPGN